MSSRYIVAEGQEFSYPADLISQQVIKSAGGRSKLTEEDKQKVKIKTVMAGEDCSDMPASALALYLERGLVLKVLPPVEMPPQVEPVSLIKEPALPAEEEGE
jgi:hypothetical protein